MRNLGTIPGQMVKPSAFGIKSPVGTPVRTTDAAIASGNTFLISELEKRDPKVREPLTSFTYARDIPIRVGGGWVESTSALNIDYGVTEGSDDSLVQAGGANAVPVIQANLNKDKFSAHIYSIVMRIPFVDMQRQAITGRSLEQMLTKGVRLSYDKHLDANVYVGMAKYGTTGLLNSPFVTASPASTGASGSTNFRSKTPEEILADINSAILTGWENSEWDLSAIPNHVLTPYDQYNYIATTKVSDLATMTILEFLLQNNVATKNGSELVIAATAYCSGTGAGGTDRMIAYRHDEDYMAVDEFVPMNRTMTMPNVDKVSYDSIYMANLSEVQIYYTQPISYVDGI
ncbi:MAG: DUF2184 domain-containing protein [Oscillospiraceae bacterium]|nr:DUF2184 domain-containing protein [Oscillospiraceae bacterium]